MLNTQLLQGFGTVSIKEFAKSIGKPTSTVYSWKRNGNIPKECFTQIGKLLFVNAGMRREYNYFKKSKEAKIRKSDSLFEELREKLVRTSSEAS